MRALVRIAWLCLAAVAGTGPPAGAGTEPAYRIALSSAPVTLDPRFVTDVVSYRLVRLLFDAPVDFDAQQAPVPDLTVWRRVAPGRYRFEIVREARFSNGDPVTAADLAATYQSVIAKDSLSPHKGGLAHVDRIDIVDDRTVEFQLSRPDPLFPGRLVIGVIPEAAAARARGEGVPPAGSGPFAFVSWPSEGQLILKRHSDGARFEFLTVKDPTVRVLKLARGEVDLLPDGISFELVEWMREREGVTVIDAGGTTFSYLGVNFAHPLTGDRRLREALARAVDRAAIVEHLFHGRARIGVSLLPPDHWSSDPNLRPWTYDPVRARALVDEIEAERGQPIRLSYKTSANPFRLRLATILKHMFAEVGIDTEIRSYDWGTFYADVKAGRFELYSLSWVGLKLPDIYRYVFHSESVPPSGANRGRYENPTVDTLIEAAEAAPTLVEQTPLWQAVQRQVHADLAYIPLWYEDRVAAFRSGLQGFALPRDGRWDALETITRAAP